MKRRSFLAAGTSALVGAGAMGCSTIKVTQKHSEPAFDKVAPKPVGQMKYNELGKTGIKVPHFGFGSHVRSDLIPFEKERERMILEACDYGVNFFDVYDHEQKCYQYEPMGRYLKHVKNDVTISISILPWEGRTLEQEMERDLRLFNRDYIDMVRIHTYFKTDKNWGRWDQLFKWKEEGKIRAVGIPIHGVEELNEPLENYPIDYVIFPYNFYHNWAWLGYERRRQYSKDFDTLAASLKAKGIGTIGMKPFASEWLITTLMELGEKLDKTGEVNVATASLKYALTSDAALDTVIGGMYYPHHVRENIQATFNPKMTVAERDTLVEIRKRAKVVAQHHLPDHYKFLENWAPDVHDNSDLMSLT